MLWLESLLWHNFSRNNWSKLDVSSLSRVIRVWLMRVNRFTRMLLSTRLLLHQHQHFPNPMQQKQQISSSVSHVLGQICNYCEYNTFSSLMATGFNIPYIKLCSCLQWRLVITLFRVCITSIFFKPCCKWPRFCGNKKKE